MSGNVEKSVTPLLVSSVCPIVLNTAEQILSYKTASSVSIPNLVPNGLEICYPNDYTYLQVWTQKQAPKCCYYSSQQVALTNTSVYY